MHRTYAPIAWHRVLQQRYRDSSWAVMQAATVTFGVSVGVATVCLHGRSSEPWVDSRHYGQMPSCSYAVTILASPQINAAMRKSSILC